MTYEPEDAWRGTREDLLKLGDRIDDKVGKLEQERDKYLEHANQGGPDARLAKEQAWAKQDAINGAKQFANKCRTASNAMAEGDTNPVMADQAMKVEHTVEMGGHLNDPRWYAEGKVQRAAEAEARGEPTNYYDRQEVADYKANAHPAQREAEAREATGNFKHEPRVEGRHFAHHRLVPDENCNAMGEPAARDSQPGQQHQGFETTPTHTTTPGASAAPAQDAPAASQGAVATAEA